MNAKLLCLFAAAIATNASASPLVLDQSFETYGGYASVSADLRQAQTFVVGISGELAKLELALRPEDIRDLTSPAEVQVLIVRTYNHVPRALPEDVLATATASFPNAGFLPVETGAPQSVQPFLWVPIDLPPTAFVAGDELGIVLSSSTSHGYQWATAFPGSYPLGEGYTGPPANMGHPLSYNQRDYLFRTYMAPIPEPSTMLFTLFALVTLPHRHRKAVPQNRS